mmetsp:Transcript_2350/g.5376  ORF Transcript_2350/g.5376 Transcript_2350/m.5376 type:complete len:275 (-) Transcript_2350:2412-3236(-)
MDHMAVFDQNNLVRGGQVVEIVRDKDDCFVLQDTANAFLEDVATHMRIDSAESIVEEIHSAVAVDSPRKGNPLLLASGEVDSVLPNLGLVPGTKNFEVGLQCTRLDDLLIPRLVEVVPKDDILADCCVADPWNLRRIRHTEGGNAPLRAILGLQFAQDSPQESALPTSGPPDDHRQSSRFDDQRCFAVVGCADRQNVRIGPYRERSRASGLLWPGFGVVAFPIHNPLFLFFSTFSLHFEIGVVWGKFGSPEEPSLDAHPSFAVRSHELFRGQRG